MFQYFRHIILTSSLQEIVCHIFMNRSNIQHLLFFIPVKNSKNQKTPLKIITRSLRIDGSHGFYVQTII